MVYKDGSEYRGNMIDGIYNGQGYYVWPTTAPVGDEFAQKKTGHTYVGYWKNGMMNGSGRFSHKNGFILEPTFCNNLALLSNGTQFADPFMNSVE